MYNVGLGSAIVLVCSSNMSRSSVVKALGFELTRVVRTCRDEFVLVAVLDAARA